MDARHKSYLSFGLAALALLCVTVLRALQTVDTTVLLYVYGLAFAALGFYHAPSPSQSATAPPPGNTP